MLRTVVIKESRKELAEYLDLDKYYILGFRQTAKSYDYVIYPFQYITNHLMQGSGKDIILNAYMLDVGDKVTIYD